MAQDRMREAMRGPEKRGHLAKTTSEIPFAGPFPLIAALIPFVSWTPVHYGDWLCDQ